MRLGWFVMTKISVKVTFDKRAAMAGIRAASDDALTAVGEQALADVTQYVPRDQGTLQSSGLSDSDIAARDGVYTLRWDTPYAQYLWHGDVMYGNPDDRSYGPAKIRFTEALAREEWAKYAAEVHGENWGKVYEAALKRRLEE